LWSAPFFCCVPGKARLLNGDTGNMTHMAGKVQTQPEGGEG
jgi:hypothetical protein